MKIGTTVRNMGEQSSTETLTQCAAACEAACQDGWLESIWITDHIAIPPDDAEGSGGRYLDTLTALAWLGGRTEKLFLGSGVLILPYRAKLPVAKQVATLQELTHNRLLLGVGIGWMDAEFRALGVDRHQRGAISDEVLRFLNECFANEVVSQNGQEFLFKPRPPKPPILIGGAAPHALRRAAVLGDGWMPMARQPDKLAPHIEAYRTLVDASGRGEAAVTVMTRLPLQDLVQAQEVAAQWHELGIDRLVCSIGYDDISGYRDELELLNRVVA